MKEEIVSKLSSREWYSYGRCQGNTTRQIDIAIQLLFQGKKVALHDHHENGHSEVANKNLFIRVRNRLIMEHRITEKDVKIEKREVIGLLNLKR